MSFKTTTTHWEIIIEFMENHKNLAHGFICGPSGKDTTKNLWQELTVQLNSAGHGERSIKKWQKTWTDFKHLLKKKAAELKQQQNITGGGPRQIQGLSDIEKRVLCILGPTFYQGVGRLENGCNTGFQQISESSVTEPLQPRNSCVDLRMSSSFSKSNLPSSSTSNTSISTERTQISNETCQQIFFQEKSTSINHPKKRSLNDHDYLKIPMQSGPKRVKTNAENPMESMYKETLNELREIKGFLKEIANCGKGIQSALERIAERKQ